MAVAIQQEYVTTARAAEIMRCSQRTITRLAAQKPSPINWRRTASGIIVELHSLLAYAASKGVDVAGEPPSRVSVQEAARSLGCSTSLVRGLIAHGRLQAAKPPGGGGKCGWRVDRRSLVNYMRQQGVPAGWLDEVPAWVVLVVGPSLPWALRLKQEFDAGWRVVAATNALEAGVLTAKTMPLAVAYDTSMADPDVGAMVKLWRANGCRLAVALAREDDSRPQDLSNAGFDVVLRKPVAPKDLAASVREGLAR